MILYIQRKSSNFALFSSHKRDQMTFRVGTHLKEFTLNRGHYVALWVLTPHKERYDPHRSLFLLGPGSLFFQVEKTCLMHHQKHQSLVCSRATILNSFCLALNPTPDPNASPSNVKLARRKTNGIYFTSGSFAFGWGRACQFQADFLQSLRKLYLTQKLFSLESGLSGIYKT